MSDVPACGHSQIKRITWSTGGSGQSEKFMCLDCNTDFIPLTGEIRDFLWRKRMMNVEFKDKPKVEFKDLPKSRNEAITYPPPIVGKNGALHRNDGIFVELPYQCLSVQTIAGTAYPCEQDRHHERKHSNGLYEWDD